MCIDQVENDVALAGMYNPWFSLSSYQSQAHSRLQGPVVKFHMLLIVLASYGLPGNQAENWQVSLWDSHCTHRKR